MWIVTTHTLENGINHVSLPPGTAVLTVSDYSAGQISGPLNLWCKQPEIPPALENHVFLVVGWNKPEPDAALGSKWRYIASSITAYSSKHVFELVPDRVVGTRYGYGEQLAGEGR